MTFTLTHDQIHEIRTAGLTDRWFADKLNVDRLTVRAARRGRTHKSHPTPPDIAPRDPPGLTFAIRSGLPQKAVPARIRRPNFNR